MNAHIIKLFGQPDKGIIQFFFNPTAITKFWGSRELGNITNFNQNYHLPWK